MCSDWKTFHDGRDRPGTHGFRATEFASTIFCKNDTFKLCVRFNLNSLPAVFRCAFCARDELEALVAFAGKFRTRRVERTHPEVLTRPEREMPTSNALKGDFFKTHFH